MPLEEFPLLQDNTRLIRHKDTLYKLKVKYEELTNELANEALSTEKAHCQIENTFRALLYILQRDEMLNLKPVQTENFLISIILTPWSFCKKYGFSQNGKELKAYPVQFEFRIKVQQYDIQDKNIVNVNVETTKPTKSKVSEEVTEVVSEVSEENAQISEAGYRVDAVTGPRFTRNSRGSLVRDGKRVISKDSGKGQGNDSAVSKVSTGSGNAATIQRTDRKDTDTKSADSRDWLKRKPKPPEDQLSELSGLGLSKRSRTSDNGLKVERYHNRNNSSVSAPPRHLGQSREPFVGKRHSQRLRTKEYQRQKESSTEISESESEYKEIQQTTCGPVKGGAKHNNEAEISESEYSEIDSAKNKNLRSEASKTRKRRRENVDKNANLESSSVTEIEDEGKNVISQDKPSLRGNSKSKHIKSNTDVKAASVELAQESKIKKHKLYRENTSPVMLSNLQSHDKDESINSPRVSTVLPQKRARSKPSLQSPRPTRQQTLVRSPVDQVDLIASSRQVTNYRHALDEESQRIRRMQQQAPMHRYRNILLAQSRDRHMIEQAERVETDKLRQLYEPTAVRRSPRLQEQEKDSGLWQKFIGAVITPFKNIVTGNRRRWSDVH